MNDENLNQISGINEAEMPTFTPEEPNISSNSGLTPDEPTNTSGGGGSFLVAVLVIAIVALLGTCVYGALDGGSKGERFVKMLTDDYIFGMTKEMTELSMKDGKVKSELTIDAGTIFSTLDVELESVDDLILLNEQSKKGTDLSGRIAFKLDSSEIASIDYAKTGDMFGIKIPDLIEEYIVIENDNLKELARKFGLSEEEIETIPDKITEEEINKLYSETLEKQNIDSKRAEKILQKYKKPVSNSLSDNITSEKKQEITINGETISCTKHTLSISEKSISEMIMSILNVAKDDKDLYELAKEQKVEDMGDITFEEWQEEIQDSIEQGKMSLESASNDVIGELNVYVKGGDTRAIEFVFPENDILIKISGTNKNNTSYIDVAIEYIEESDDSVRVTFETEKEKDKYETNVNVKVNIDPMNVSMNVFKYTLEYDKEVSLDKINESNAFILNNEDMSAIEDKAMDIQNELVSYLGKIYNRLPAELVEDLSKIQESTSDLDYDLSLGDEEDVDFDSNDYSEKFELKEAQKYILNDSTAKYESIKLNSTKEDVLALMGKPTYEDSYEDEEFYYWSDEYYNDHSVKIENGVVVRKGRSISSSSYDGIQLSTEIGTKIPDLEAIADSIKEDMTLSEIKAILGDKYIETERDTEGYYTYEWYDVKENSISVEFNKNNVASYVGLVWPSY